MSNGRSLFGTDGMRGVANLEPMTGATVMRLGMAIAARLRQPGRHTRIAIGKDTRLSGYMFESALAAGIVLDGRRRLADRPAADAGHRVHHVVDALRRRRRDLARRTTRSRTTASRSSRATATSCPTTSRREIEALMSSPELDAQRAAPADVGYSRKIEDSRGRYVVFCKSTFPSELTLDGLRIVVDGAHGAAYRVGPAVFEELGAKVIAIHTKPDGKNINARAGALHPQAMCETVQAARRAHRHRARRRRRSRACSCDEHGNVVDGDAVMALCATRMLQRRPAREADAGRDRDVEPRPRARDARAPAAASCARRSATATSSRRCASSGYNLGGEQSGHLVFLDHATTGDGIVAALRVLAIMVERGPAAVGARDGDDAHAAGAGQHRGREEGPARPAARRAAADRRRRAPARRRRPRARALLAAPRARRA